MPAKKSVHFLTGSDEAGVKKAAVELAAKLAPGADAFGLETIDGAVDTVDSAVSRINEARQALLTLPFLGGAKLVWLKSASFLSDTQTGRSESVLEALEGLLETLTEGLPEGVTFLLSATAPDKRRTAYKALVKLADTQIIDKPDLGFGAGEEAVIDWTASQARERGLKISHDAVEALAARIGLETCQLASELDKLILAFGHGHPITAADVRALVPATRESGIFDIGNAIGARDLATALGTMRQLLSQGESAIGILLASIVPTVRNLLFVKELLLRHKLSPPAQPQFFASTLNRLPAVELAHLPRKKDGSLNAYPLGIAARNSAHYSLDELRRGFRECAAANLRLVTSSLAQDVVLSRLLIGFMAREGAESPDRMS